MVSFTGGGGGGGGRQYEASSTRLCVRMSVSTTVTAHADCD